MALARDIPQTDPAYAILEQRLNNCVNVVASIDVADLLLVHPTKAEEMDALRSIQLIQESIPEVRRAYDTSINCIIGAVLLNSPILFLILPAMLFAAIFFGKAQAFLSGYKTKAWALSGTPGLCPA